MKRMRKKWISLLLVSLMTVGAVGSAVADGAATNSDDLTLIVRDNETGTLVGADSTTEFQLNVYRGDDQFIVYQLAEMDWDSTLLANKGSFQNAAWVTPVQNWINANAEYSAYATPELLGEEGQKDSSAAVSLMRAIQSALNPNSTDYDATFAAAMADYKVASKTGDTYAGATGNTWSVGGKSFTSSVTPVTHTKESDTIFDNLYTISGLAFGLYMVDPQNSVSQRNYQPLLVDVSPDQTGPSGNWYYGEAVVTSLKYQDVTIDKYINGEPYKNDIVKKGETVTFKIQLQVPEYPADAAKKIMYINDDMAAGFSLQVDTIKFKYSKDDGTSWNDLTSDYSLITAKDANIFYATGSDGKEKEFAFSVPHETTETSKTYTTYYLDNGAAKFLGNYGTDASAITQIMTAYNNQVAAAEKVTGAAAMRDYKKSVINAVFNYEALMETAGAQVTDIRLEYDAVINENMFIGSDENTNIATLYFIQDSTGTIGSVSDTVRAWTYAANIVKIDGDTAGDTDPTYLAGAEFDLYRLTDIYCDHTGNAGTDMTDYSSYTWKSNQDGATNYTEAGLTETLDGVKGKVFYRPVKVETDECDTCSSVHYHIQVYQLFETGITSTGNVEGITVKGLDPDEYILIETKAPEGGYNVLSEGVWFEIDKYTDEKYATAGNTYRGFTGDDGQDYVDGIYPIQVLNFQGVQLPSTGGIGTMLFTVIGIIMMLAVIVTFVVLSRKKRQER